MLNRPSYRVLRSLAPSLDCAARPVRGSLRYRPLSLAFGVLSFAPVLLPLGIREAAAQVLYGSLTGNVSDPSGAVIPHASIQAKETATGVVRNTITNSEGIYQLTELAPAPTRSP